MGIDIAELLFKVRKLSTKKLFNLPFNIVNWIAIVVLSIVAIVVDIYVPWGTDNQSKFLFLLLRAIIALVIAVFMTMKYYLVQIRRSEYELSSLEALRNYYSQKQRGKIVIPVLFVTYLFVGVFAKVRTPAYTFTSSVAVFILLACILFYRSTREEVKMDALGIPDLRDYKNAKERLDKADEDDLSGTKESGEDTSETENENNNDTSD